MLDMTAFSPQTSERILRYARKVLHRLGDAGIDSCPNVSVENYEYVVKLLGVESVFGFHRTQHDQEIVFRLCEQLRRSGIPELERWADERLNWDVIKLRQDLHAQEALLDYVTGRIEGMDRAIA